MDKTSEQTKIRVLALCDSPTVATGFAQVSRNVLGYLAKTGKYEIDVIGINYYGDYYDRNTYPYNIYPAQPQGYNDMYGRTRLLNAMNGGEEKTGLRQGWDIIFTIQDPFIMEGLGIQTPFAEQMKVTSELFRRTVPPNFWYTWIGYYPVDSAVKENWVTRAIALTDIPVAYCQWGLDQMMVHDREKFETVFNLAINKEGEKRRARLYTSSLKDRAMIIHHGVDLSVFKPLSEKERKLFRKEFFDGKLDNDTYLVVNISRNQPRKDVARTMKVFSEFKKRVKKSHLYLHCKENDAGGSIHEMARNFHLIPGEDYTVPKDFSAGIGYPVDIVNKIYNAADLCITTTLGEGWGFITTEAMATKTPIVAPYITSIQDIFGPMTNMKDWPPSWDPDVMRGIPVVAGSTSSEWICMGLEDNERIRPLTNVDDMVEKMVWAFENPEKVKAMTERAYEWVQQLDWALIGKQWDDVFMKAFENLRKLRVIGQKIDKAGRNDPCPCGSGKKFKKCHGSDDRTARFADWLGEIEGNDVKNKLK